jgi:GGDEF domain-containing protein
MGGDEFSILAIEAETDGQKMIDRLDMKLETLATSQDYYQPLALSSGFAHYDPNEPRTIDDVLAEADSQMYEQKQRKKDTFL